MSDSSDNQFAGLLAPTEETPVTVNNEGVQNNESMICDIEETKLVNDIVENVFHFTINPELSNDINSKKQLIYLQDFAETMKPSIYIDLETLEQALFERLLIPKPISQVIPKTQKAILSHVVQDQVFPYLFDSMRNLQSYEANDNEVVIKSVKKIKELIFRNAVTALKQPTLFEGQVFDEQLIDLLRQIDPLSQNFFEEVINSLMAENPQENYDHLYNVAVPMLVKIYLEIIECNVINLPLYILPAVKIFAGNKHLAPIFMTTCEPKTRVTGKRYHDSVLGALLCLSVLPKSSSVFEYFDDPLDLSANSVIESSLWNSTSHLVNQLHKIFIVLLKNGPEIKSRILQWIGNCLAYNIGRGRLGSEEGITFDTFSSDGFMINLGAVLLQLCQPFCNYQDPDPKYLKIDPTYPAVPPDVCLKKGAHYCMHKETCLLPPPQNELDQSLPRQVADSFNFVTECFFMTHACISLGYKICAEKMTRLGQSVGRIRSAQQDRVGKYLSYRCAVLEPTMLDNLQRMQAMTCTWLMQVAARPPPPGPLPSYAPGNLVPIELPLKMAAPDTLRCVPEMILENLIAVITLSRRAEAVTFGASSSGPDSVDMLSPAMTVVLAFMGDSTRTYNPHLRARLAEILEAMLPNQESEELPLGSLSSVYRQQLFKEHPHRLQLIPNILEIFVSIEMTGQSVQFEQKFNYRRPMYAVLDYLWTIEEHRDVYTELANEAEANMEAVNPPILLRFINLLMNDAVFLLDEALANMALIRNLQARRASPGWSELPAEERSGVASSLTQTGMMARFDNLLGRDTVKALVRLTGHAPHVFCHPTLVDRIASTLNYFLLHLVGPNKKNFKVKDMKEYSFEPGSTVLDICTMYTQLGHNERFCAAVAADGRSYSPQLFQQALDVLARIGGGHLMGDLQSVESRVSEAAAKQLLEDQTLSHAPEDFIDPIMSTLMVDPVILPSSKVTIDRTTIARHLLSDQSDPFNRSPLSMDMVVSNTELKEKIHAWIAEQRKKMEENKENMN